MKNLTHSQTLDVLPKGKIPFALLCLSLSVILGLLVRLPYFFKYDFALNDGALFVQMSEAIRANNYVLPATVGYNQTEIPFAYPPLAFYLVAFLADSFALDILDVVRYMPLGFNILSICVFILLISSLIKNQIILLYTSLFFPLIPRSYEWLIMGGGVTRSVGFFFALIAAYQGNRILSKRSLEPFVLCSLFLSMAALSHLEWGITGVVTVSLLILSKQFSKRSFLLIIALGTVVLVVTAPWWITVLTRHGFDPFMAASKTSEWNLFRFENLLLGLKVFDDGLGAPLSVLAVIGWLLSVIKGDWFLPLWLVAIFLTTPRHGPTAGAMPLAILASIGLAQFLMPRLIQTAAAAKNKFSFIQINWSRSFRKKTFFQHLSPGAFVASCIVSVTLILVLTQTNYVKQTPLVALTASERSAMSWIKNNTPAKSEFVLLSRSSSWEGDRIAEWFPVLSDRKSLTTAQGLEWMPGDLFRSKVESIKALKRNQALGNKLVRYIESHYNSSEYIAAFMPHINSGYGGFVQSGQYRVAYNSESVFVFERT